MKVVQNRLSDVAPTIVAERSDMKGDINKAGGERKLFAFLKDYKFKTG